MALGNVRNSRPKEKEPSINITSMMDMFTIIVFFLLFSYSSNPEDIPLEKEVYLPTSSSVYDYTNSVKLFLSSSSIKMEEELVAKLENGKVVDLNVKKIEESMLYKKLKKRRDMQFEEANKLAIKTGEGIRDDFHLLFFCDRNMSFKTINLVIKVAAEAGYPNFQLAVLES